MGRRRIPVCPPVHWGAGDWEDRCRQRHFPHHGGAYNDMNVMWTNASDDRGISHPRGSEELRTTQRCRSKEKVVVLDEADGLTNQAQDAIRYHGSMPQRFSSSLPPTTLTKSALQSRVGVRLTFRRVSAEHGASHLTRLTESCGVPVDWEPYYGDVVEYHGATKAAVASLERIPKTADAIKQFTVKQTEDEWWDTISNKWNELREHLIEVLHSSGDSSHS